MAFENGRVLRVVVSATNTTIGSEVNTFHYDLVDLGGIEGNNDPQSLADFFRDNVLQHVVALFSSAWQVQPVTVMEERDPKNPFAPRGEWTSGVAQPGQKGGTTEPLPPACCAVATLKTAHVGRRYTGRTFLFGDMHEADQNNGQWLAAPMALWQAYLDSIPRQPDISGAASASTANWAVYSRTQRASSLTPYISHVQSVIPHNVVHWLRSRAA